MKTEDQYAEQGSRSSNVLQSNSLAGLASKPTFMDGIKGDVTNDDKHLIDSYTHPWIALEKKISKFYIDLARNQRNN